MKLFIDTANTDDIRRFSFLADGVTTNPSLIAREGRDFNEVVQEICDIVDGPISAEAVSLDAEGMIEEARELSKIHENINVKIPMTEEGLKAVDRLSDEGIKTNVTLVFSPNQAYLAAKAGATFVSPFVGRIDDRGHDGMRVVEEIMEIYCNYGFPTEVLTASIRHPKHVKEAARIGSDIATVPPDVLEKLFDHPLTDKGLDRFLEDWEKVDEQDRPF